MNRSVACLLLLLFPLTGTGTEVPFLSGRVNDTAGMLTESTIRQLETLLKHHEDSTSNQVAVLTIPDLGGEVLEEFSLKVAETWALGQADKDNGVLLLISRDDRKVRIEVGSGLEGDLTDATSGRIIRNEIVPRFRDGDFDGGVREGVVAILAAIEGAYEGDDEWSGDDFFEKLFPGIIFFVVVGTFTIIAVTAKGFISWFLFVFLIPFWITFPYFIFDSIVPFFIYFFGFILLKILLAKTPTGRRISKKFTMAGGSGWSSGSGSFSSGGFSGSSFSGGGGSFSGGGASGSW